MAGVLGIDFGTTNSSAAFFDAQGKLRLVPIRDKVFMLPSVVWYRAADKAVVGHAARSQLIDDPKHTFFEAKRFLGRRFNSEYVSRNRERFAYELVEGPDGYCAFEVYGQIKSLTDVAQRVIEQLAAHAAHAAGEPFTRCVITTPVHAGARQRAALRLAAERAGLEVLAIVNEPTAAALYYANLRNPEQVVLIFDLGGGTFDATLLSVRNRVVEVLGVGGDAFLGGADFDAAILDTLVERFRQQHGVDLRTNRIVMQRLLLAAESAKMALTERAETQLRVPFVVQKGEHFVDFDFTVTRAELEALCFKLMERAAAAVDDVLQEAGLPPQGVDELVLVGGQTRMPAIRERFKAFKRVASERDVHPELGVAIGAAVLGRNLDRGTSGLADVAPIPVHVMLPGGRTLEAIPANTPLPGAREIALEGLPAWPGPVPVVLFEALDASSTEREILGSLSIPAELRLSGAPKLELSIGQNFQMRARLAATSGAAADVAISDPAPMRCG